MSRIRSLAPEGAEPGRGGTVGWRGTVAVVADPVFDADDPRLAEAIHHWAGFVLLGSG